MKRLLLTLSVFLLVFTAVSPSGAQLVNGGFETGNWTGWLFDNPGGAPRLVMMDDTTYGGSKIYPIERLYMAKTEAGGSGVYNDMAHYVYLYPGDRIYGYALFAGGYYDATQCTDYGAVRIYVNSTSDYNLVAQPWYRDIKDVGGGSERGQQQLGTLAMDRPIPGQFLGDHWRVPH